MLFGAHISAAGGVDKAPARAAAVGCEVFQFFSRPPQGGPPPRLTEEIVNRFREAVASHGQREHYIHTPYFVNFASPNPRIQHGTIAVIRGELERGTLLGSRYVMTHLGSARALGETKGIAMTVTGLSEVLKTYRGKTQLLLELAAGAGATLGDTFEELATIIEQVEKRLRRREVLNVCFDTQHAFASGYDMRTPKALTTTLANFDKHIGKKRLRLIHLNDSKTALGSHVDRHENLTHGTIGRAGFRALVQSSALPQVNCILETPRDEKGTELKRELRLLKSYRRT